MKSQFVSIVKRHALILSGAGAIFLLYFANLHNYIFLYFFIQFLAIAAVINYFLKIWSSANYFNKPYRVLVRDLNQSHERYITLVEYSPEAIAVCTRGVFTYLNPSGLKLFGAKKLNDIIGKKALDFIHQDYRDSVRKYAQKIKHGEKAEYLREFQILRLDGGIRYVEAISNAIMYEGKRSMQVIIRDITEQKSVEKIIQDARVYAESIVNTVRDPLVVLDENLKIVSANWAFYYTFRFLREKSEGILFYEIYNNYWDIPALKENLEKVIKNNIPIHNFEISHNFPQIGRRIIIFNARRIYQANEQSPRFLLSIRDFTEKKRSEEQIRQSEEKYRNIFDNASDAIITIDLQDNITSWNKSAETMFGWRSDEIIGKKFGVLVVPKNFYLERDRILKDVFLGKNLTGIETVRMKKDKSKINVSITTSPIFNEKREIVGLSAIIRDITKQKEIDKAKTEFVSIASHELRTPLANMSLSVEMILDSIAGPLNPEQKKYLRGIYRDIKGMAGLVDALLNVSRIELRTMVIEPEPASLYEIMENVLKEIAPQINKKDLKIRKVFDSALPVINVDRNLMRIILQNLLSNAIKYTPSAGKIGIEIKKDKNDALIKVSDNGCGVPKDQQGKIFQKLFRARNVIDRRVEGVGLGLYIVKSIVNQCGGKIWVESEENKGTAFYVKIPLAGMKKRG